MVRTSLRAPKARGGAGAGCAVLAAAFLCAGGLSTAAAPAAAAAPAPPAAGTPITAYIAALREAGFEIAYSDALLTARMRVRAEPQAGAPLDGLRTVLAPYGLALERGPRGRWLVVEAPRAAGAAAAPRAAGPGGSAAPRLENIVVSASRYEIGRENPASSRELEQAALGSLPALGDDALRAAASLPGLTAGGLSAKFHVRGGDTDEALLYLDGVRLYNPYHLKDFQSLFSSISPRLLESVEVHTGGYPAEFGDRMSGVVDMRTTQPAAEPHYEVEASLLTTSLLGSGRFAGGRGSWLTSLRRSNLDLLADRSGSKVGDPIYGDFFNELGFEIGPELRVTAGTLLLNDKLTLRDPEIGSAHADYDDGYLWLRAVDERPRLSSSYLFSHTALEDGRGGEVRDLGVATGTLHEHRRYDDDAVKADWTLRLSDRGMLRFGGELDAVRARYDFVSSAERPVPIDTGPLAQPPSAVSIDETLSGDRQAAYAAYRVRPAGRFTAEAGLRWDAQSYLHASELSPRLNLMVDVGQRATVRAAWGRFYQAQDLGELQVGDGSTTLYPPQEAEHAVLGFDYLLGQAATLRVEAYRKDFLRLQPRFENLYYRVTLLPELLPDRVMISPEGGRASGIEVDFDGESGPWSWWLALAHASVYDVLDGRRVPRSWDEPWSLKAGGTWNAPRWTATVTATAHAGWPTTALTLTDRGLAAGALDARRFPTFATLDVKATRRVPLEHGDFSWFVELNNALDRANPCCFEYSVTRDAAGRPVALGLERTSWLPLVPTFGVRWDR